MKLIVGLGNPGKLYENTRHNIGFMVIDYIAKQLKFDFKSKMDGLYFLNEDIIYLKPQNYINLSGDVIKKYIDYYKINIEDIFIIHDDLDIPTGKYKLKQKGSSGGHNGLKNIEQNLKTDEYKRLKIGISSENRREIKDYVLGTLTKEDKEVIDDVIKKAYEIIRDYNKLTFVELMNKYN